MSERITLDVPEQVAERARVVARGSGRDVAAVLVEWLDRAATDIPVESLPDDQLLAARDLQMEADEQAALSELLARQREGVLTDDERARLDELLALYRRAMVRKARALKAAVARGLQPPLSAT